MTRRAELTAHHHRPSITWWWCMSTDHLVLFESGQVQEEQEEVSVEPRRLDG